jgi:hypothetical protein
MRRLQNRNNKYCFWTQGISHQASGPGLPLFSFLLLVVCCLLLASGCGYSTRSLIGQLYKTIHVRPFVNKIDITSDTSVARKYKTYHPLLENDVTRKVIDRFILDGNLRIAKEEGADLVLYGELVDYRRDALRFTGEDDKEVEEYRINIVVNLKLYDSSEQTWLWEVNGFAGDASYFTQGSLVTSESSAINEAVSDLARRIVNRTVDIW